MMRPKLNAGKLPPELLKKWLSRIEIADERVVIGPRYGEDAAVIDFGDRYLVAKTDPITFTAERLGWYAVNINANDVAVMGATPKWFLASLLLPEGRTDEALVDRIFADLIAACREVGVTLCGGHTEITREINQPIMVGQMLGEVNKGYLRSIADARAGDRILLTRGVAIEGTSIIANELADDVRLKLGEEFRLRAAGFLTNPGISVMKEALIAAKMDGVVALHDPTEGGLAAGLAEVAAASETGMRTNRDSIYIYPETKTLCDMYNLNPLGLIASGALLIVVRPEFTKDVISKMAANGELCCEISELTSGEELIIYNSQGEEKMEFSSIDEITKLPRSN